MIKTQSVRPKDKRNDSCKIHVKSESSGRFVCLPHPDICRPRLSESLQWRWQVQSWHDPLSHNGNTPPG